MLKAVNAHDKTEFVFYEKINKKGFHRIQPQRNNNLTVKKSELYKKKNHFSVSVLAVIVFLSMAFSNPLPKLFLIGDSISIRYCTFLENYMQGIVQFERKQDNGSAEKNLDVPTGANGGDSRMVLEYLQVKVQDSKFNPDYLLLNCGLHDIKRDPETNKIQISEKEYRKNLKAIIHLMQKKEIQLIWIRTTPVVDSIHNSRSIAFHRFAADVQAYNKIADEICAKEKIPVIDLFSFTQKLGVGQLIDHVHYKEPALEKQAVYIAGFLQCYLNKCLK